MLLVAAMRTLEGVNLILFCPQKVEKTTLKSCSEKLESTFFSLMAAQPKWPQKKNSCS
jgi:hypothetical protein